MNTFVINLRKAKTNLQELLVWCNNNFGDLAQITYPALAELHRVSYDSKVTGIVVFYFKEESDYFLFLLKWQ